MEQILLETFLESLQVTILVFVMMVLVDLLNVWTRGKIEYLLRKKKTGQQYIITSLIGTVPGCVGAFTNVSLYIHGMISFGALAGGMIAASGDEAFVMLALFPKTAVLLFGILFLLGIVGGVLVDKVVKRFRIKTCEGCADQVIHETEHTLHHFLVEHLWHHIIRKHLWKVALWTFGALILIAIGKEYLHLETLTAEFTLGTLLLAAVLGFIPESGPHLIFVTLFADGLVPFSVLLTSAIAQDGHGMLPMLSYSVKDSLVLKTANVIISVLIGFTLYLVGW